MVQTSSTYVLAAIAVSAAYVAAAPAPKLGPSIFENSHFDELEARAGQHGKRRLVFKRILD
jgi:hypothetical protein